MEPSDLYNKSKRNLAIFTAFLALVLFGRVAPDEGGKLLGFKLSPDAVPTVLFFVVAYLLYQFVLARAFQSDAVRARRLVSFDFGILATAAGLVLFVYLLWYLPQLYGVSLDTLWSVAAILFGALGSSFALYRSSELFRSRRDVHDLRKRTIRQRLQEPGWIMEFNPKIDKGSKRISFEADGTIGEGRNSNEFRWSLEDGNLIIRRENGSLQNKFQYHPDIDLFESIDDPQALGLKGQFIYREEQQS